MKKVFKRWCAIGLLTLVGVQSLSAAKLEGKMLQTQVEEGKLHTFFNYNSEEDLKKEDVVATIGDKSVPIQSIERVSQLMPHTSYLILMDTSTSIKEEDKVKIETFLEHMLTKWGEKAEFALMTFGEDIENVQPFTSDRFELYKNFKEIPLKDQSTNLYTALVEGVEYYKAKTTQEGEKQHIVVVTDGAEYDEEGITKDEADRVLKEAGIPVYTLGLYRTSNKDKSEVYMEELGSFARLTGGMNLVYGQKAEVTMEVLANAMNDHILNTYYASFDASGLPADGASHYFNMTISESTGEKTKVGTQVQMDIKVQEEVVEEATEVTEPQEPIKKTNEKMWLGITGISILVITIVILIVVKKRKKKREDNEVNEEEVVADTKEEEKVQPMQKTVRLSAEKAPMRIELIEIGRMRTARHVKIALKDQVIMGRTANKCDVVLEGDETLSGMHCKLFKQDGKLYLLDLGSTNGTYVNGLPIKEAMALNQDDVLLIGAVEYRIKWSQS